MTLHPLKEGSPSLWYMPSQVNGFCSSMEAFALRYEHRRTLIRTNYFLSEVSVEKSVNGVHNKALYYKRGQQKTPVAMLVFCIFWMVVLSYL